MRTTMGLFKGGSMKFAWLTDIHLNFIHKKEDREKFYQKIVNSGCDEVLITGDIAEAPSVCDMLKEMVSYIDKRVFFVLGNHDYYRGSIKRVRESMYDLCRHDCPKLRWLGAPDMPAISRLPSNVCIIGIDGWYDGRYGNYVESRVQLSDFLHIEELANIAFLGKMKLLSKIQELADNDASVLDINMNEIIKVLHPKQLIILTHIPPFKEACLYRGEPTDDRFLPFYSCKATGDIIQKYAETHPNIEFLVLCGHTHGKADVNILPNLRVRAGGSEYSNPVIQGIIEIE